MLNKDQLDRCRAVGLEVDSNGDVWWGSAVITGALVRFTKPQPKPVAPEGMEYVTLTTLVTKEVADAMRSPRARNPSLSFTEKPDECPVCFKQNCTLSNHL